MRIAIQAADLDNARIDGTRVYILNLLRRFGKMSPEDDFLIYHRKNFNPELAPEIFPNYREKKIKSPYFWTQTRFAWEIWRDMPDALWMPMHNTPLLKSRKVRTTVTIHDLAFKIFPDHFPARDRTKLNLLTGIAVKYADKIIAVSESSKKDIIKFYPGIREEKIRVIHHGFDSRLYSSERNLEKEDEARKKYKIEGGFFLYTGAIQPRKNLILLIEAFEIFKKKTRSDMKLVLAGERAWLWREIEKNAEASLYQDDITITGKLKFCDMSHLMRSARVYVYPSLYEGFGITVLEAFSAGIPVICANNSSLPEVAGDGALFFEQGSASDLAQKMIQMATDEKMRSEFIGRGKERIKNFSWDQCARETLDWIKS